LRLREPPRIKVLEAAGAIADGRVHLAKGLTPDRLDATVVSSEGDRRYRVVVVKEGGGYRVYSDDNGTRLPDNICAHARRRAAQGRTG